MSAYVIRGHESSRGRVGLIGAKVRSETFVARAAIGAIALHVADDSFFQPQRGTSAGDHLTGGLVPIALLVAGATFYPRLRAGARATVALALGFLGLVFGIAEAGYYTFRIGPSGDDYTGLLSIAAGLVLVGIGATTLWRSRRLDDRRLWRYPRRGLLVGAAAASLWALGLPIALGYATTHIMRPIVPTANLGAAYEDVAFTTSDGLRLYGWYVPSRNGAAVIVFPGRRGPQARARFLARHGYGVLLFDRRGEGRSEGDGNMFGWGGEKDILAAIAFLKTRPDVDPTRIAGLGLSVGAELMLQTAAETGDLAALVSDGAGTRSFAEEMEELHGASKWLGLPLLAMKTASLTVFSNTAPPPKLTDLVPRIHQPLLLIWSIDGGVETMNPTYFRLAQGPTSIWGVPGVGHLGAIDAHPKEYERRVTAFLDRELAQRP